MSLFQIRSGRCSICGAETIDVFDYYRADALVSRTNSSRDTLYGKETRTVETYKNVAKGTGRVCKHCRHKYRKENLISALICAGIFTALTVVLALFGIIDIAAVLGVIGFITSFGLFFDSLSENGSKLLVRQLKREDRNGIYFTPSEAAGKFR